MASNLKIRTQEAIDALRSNVDGCTLAMLVDGETGLVLCKTSDTVVSQDQLDDLATAASTDLNGPLAIALSDNASSTDLLTGMRIGKESTIVALRASQPGQDALICQFDSPPNQSNLSAAARTVFDLTTEGEAA